MRVATKTKSKASRIYYRKCDLFGVVLPWGSIQRAREASGLSRGTICARVARGELIVDGTELKSVPAADDGGSDG